MMPPARPALGADFFLEPSAVGRRPHVDDNPPRRRLRCALPGQEHGKALEALCSGDAGGAAEAPERALSRLAKQHTARAEKLWCLVTR